MLGIDATSSEVSRLRHLSEEEFVLYCSSKLGDYPRVILKLMRHEDQYLREITMRQGLQEWYIVPILEDSTTLLPRERYLQDIQKFHINKQSLSSYEYCIVMPEANRNLDAIKRYEKPNIHQVRSYVIDVAYCLQYLHSQGIMHGDIKLLNAVRVKDRLRLIDLDAAATTINYDFSLLEHQSGLNTVCSYAGAKFTSGILPPEMFYEIHSIKEKELCEYYWQDIVGIKDKDILKKVLPVRVGNNKWIVVKSFAIDKSTNQPLQPEKLPYKLVKASTSIDCWSFGVMLFALLSPIRLLPVNDDEDLLIDHQSGSNMSILLAQSWDKFSIREKVESCIDNRSACHLLLKLLNPDPEERVRNMSQILQHPFFAPNDAAMEMMEASLQQLSKQLEDCTKKIQREFKQDLDRHQQVLLKAIIEAADSRVPSTYIIVNQRLIDSKELKSTEGSTNSDSEVNQKRLDTALRWIGKVTDFATVLRDNVRSGITSGATTLLDSAANRLLQQEQLFFYLVDEATMLPMIPLDDDPVYPISIQVQSDRTKKLLPLMKVGLNAIKVVNTGSQLARCLGYPLPSLSSEAMSKLDQAFGKVSQESSVEEFDWLQRAVVKEIAKTRNKLSEGVADDNDDQPLEQIRGQALRELEKFLEEYDPQRRFCGLQRVLDRKGKCLWTTKEHAEEIAVSGAIVPESDVDINASNCAVKKETVQRLQKLFAYKMTSDPSFESIKQEIPVLSDDDKDCFLEDFIEFNLAADIIRAIATVFFGPQGHNIARAETLLPDELRQGDQLMLKKELRNGEPTNPSSISVTSMVEVMKKCKCLNRISFQSDGQSKESINEQGKGEEFSLFLNQVISLDELKATIDLEKKLRVKANRLKAAGSKN